MRRDLWLAALLMLCLIIFSGCGTYIQSGVWQDITPSQMFATPDFCLNIADEIPYIALGNSFQANVIKYSDNYWSSVGNPDFSIGRASGIVLAFDQGTPFVAFNDVQIGKGIVMCFNGTSWERVGKTGYFSAGEVSGISMVVINNNPYIAFIDAGDAKFKVVKVSGDNVTVLKEMSMSDVEYIWKVFLKSDNTDIYLALSVISLDDITQSLFYKYSNAAWQQLNMSGFAPYSGMDSFEVYQGNLYIGFSVNARFNVVKIDGDSWEMLPDPGDHYNGIYGYGGYPSGMLSINNGVLYIAFDDFDCNHKITVKSFNGNSWLDVGKRGFSDGTLLDFTIKDSPKAVYVCFEYYLGAPPSSWTYIKTMRFIK